MSPRTSAILPCVAPTSARGVALVLLMFGGVRSSTFWTGQRVRASILSC